MNGKVSIIGTGLAGLVAGAYLSRAGFETSLFEQSGDIGGVTGGYRKNGYYWDMGQLNIEGLYAEEAAGTVIDELGLRDHLTLLPAARLYSFPDFIMQPPEVYGGPWWRKDYLTERYPEEKRGIRAYYRFYRRMRTVVTLAERAERACGMRALLLKAGMFFNLLPLLPKMKFTAKQLMDRFFTSEQIKAVFTSILADFVVRPEQFQGLGVALVNPEPAFDARVPLDFARNAHQPSYTCIDGGCRTLVDVLADYIRAHGGTIHTGKRVAAIHTEAGKVAGISCADGTSYDSQLVLASGGARETFRLLDPGSVDEAFQKIVDESPLMESVFMLHLGLDADPMEFLPSGINYCYRNYDISGSVNRLQNEIYHEGEDGYLIYVPSLYSPQSAPAGRHAVTIYTVAPNRIKNESWSEKREAFAEKLLTLASEKIPNLKAHIVEQTIFTPEDFQALTLQEHHSFGGCAPVMGQKAVPNRTPVEGFWFIGSQSESGAGINNVMSGARRISARIIREAQEGKNA